MAPHALARPAPARALLAGQVGTAIECLQPPVRRPIDDDGVLPGDEAGHGADDELEQRGVRGRLGDRDGRVFWGWEAEVQGAGCVCAEGGVLSIGIAGSWRGVELHGRKLNADRVLTRGSGHCADVPAGKKQMMANDFSLADARDLGGGVFPMGSAVVLLPECS